MSILSIILYHYEIDCMPPAQLVHTIAKIFLSTADDSDANDVLDSCTVAANPDVFEYNPNYTYPV